jgi:hypothetical protein
MQQAEIVRLIDQGCLRLGMTREEVRALLGTPSDVGATSRRYPVPAIWKYGEVEFHWPLTRSIENASEDGLILVMIDGWEGGPAPAILLSADKDPQTGAQAD